MSLSGHTIFISYILTPTTGVTTGFTQAIHCNYINSLQLNTNSPDIEEINLYFNGGASDFKFLSNGINQWDGTGYTVYEIYALVQLVDNSGFTNASKIKPNSTLWRKFDLNPQLNHIGKTTLTATELTQIVFKITLLDYDNPLVFVPYDLSYLNYPSALPIDDNELCFGDEIFFLGNVTTDIKADVYTTDISINLQSNEFVSSTNLTWDGISPVSISEIGIYDDSTPKNLVAIGKFNNPVDKDSTIARTIVFALDF